MVHHGTSGPGDRIPTDPSRSLEPDGEAVRAEIPGTVLSIEVMAGETVDEGDAVVVLESMKMEIPVVAEQAGLVSRVTVTEGDAVRVDDVVAVLTSLPDLAA